MIDLTEDDWVFAASFDEIANLICNIIKRAKLLTEELWG
jgi:hypothetical protein